MARQYITKSELTHSKKEKIVMKSPHELNNKDIVDDNNVHEEIKSTDATDTEKTIDEHNVHEGMKSTYATYNEEETVEIENNVHEGIKSPDTTNHKVRIDENNARENDPLNIQEIKNEVEIDSSDETSSKSNQCEMDVLNISEKSPQEPDPPAKKMRIFQDCEFEYLSMEEINNLPIAIFKNCKFVKKSS